MEFSNDRSSKFVALGGTFESLQASGDRTYRWPHLWLVPHESVIPAGTPIHIPSGVEDVVAAPELTAVIGEELHDATEDEAWRGIKGFTVSNDVSALGEWPGHPDPNRETTSGIMHKLFPTFAPLLHEMTPRDDIDDPADLAVSLRIDGESVVSASTAGLAFSIPELVAYASRIVHLRPNDVIALGEPAGDMVYLDGADSVTCRIESVGELSNPIEG